MVTSELKKELGRRMEMLIHLLMQKGYAKTKTDVGKLIGATTSGISQMVAGDRMMTFEHLHILREKTKLNTNWYITGVGPFFMEDEEEEDSVMIVTRAMNVGKLTIEEGEKIIGELGHRRKQVIERDQVIIDQSNEIIELQRLLKTV